MGLKDSETLNPILQNQHLKPKGIWKGLFSLILIYDLLHFPLYLSLPSTSPSDVFPSPSARTTWMSFKTIKYRWMVRRRSLKTDSLVRKCELGIKNRRDRRKILRSGFISLNLRFLDIADLCHCFIIRIRSCPIGVL